MCDLLKNKKGISLITLVITIIVVIILSAVVINTLFKNNPINDARNAVNESNKATDLERLKLAVMQCFLKNNGKNVSTQDYIDYLDEKGIIDKNDVEYEDGKAIITLEDGYIYEVSQNDNGSIETEFAGIAGNLAPKLEISVTNASTSAVTITPIVKRNDGGKLEYYIKENSESEYTLKGETNNTAYTFDNLPQDKVYDIKVIAKAPNGLEAEAITQATTSAIQAAVVTFSYSPNTWTNGNVTVTATAENIPSGMTLYIGESATSCDTLASVGITVTENKTVYAVYKDSSNQYGGAATGSVDKIDRTKPTVTSVDVTTNSVTINASDTGGSGVSKYALTLINSQPEANTFQDSNVFTASQSSTYYAWVMDTAGNISETGYSTQTSGVVTPTVTFTYDPNTWTNGNVTVTATASNIPNGMTLYIGESASNCNTLASVGITVTENKTVYAVYKDSSNQYGGAATGSVDKIDKIRPQVTSVDVTTNSATINASDTGGSGVSKYALTTTNSQPEANTFQTSNVFSASQSSTYYAWVMDAAGNISETGYSTQTSGVVTPTVTFTYNPNTWTTGNVTVTAVASNIPTDMTLYIGESATNCTTLASVGITVTENKTVYAVYKDTSNQYGGAATGEVDKIDRTGPTLKTTASSGTYNITIKAQDTASGTAAYYYSTSSSTPAANATSTTTQEANKWVTFTTTTSEVSKTLTGFTSAGTYYYWFKDAVGNISSRGTFVANAITASDIGYTPSDNTWSPGNVQQAITTLYNKYQ